MQGLKYSWRSFRKARSRRAQALSAAVCEKAWECHCEFRRVSLCREGRCLSTCVCEATPLTMIQTPLDAVSGTRPCASSVFGRSHDAVVLLGCRRSVFCCPFGMLLGALASRNPCFRARLRRGRARYYEGVCARSRSACGPWGSIRRRGARRAEVWPRRGGGSKMAAVGSGRRRNGGVEKHVIFEIEFLTTTWARTIVQVHALCGLERPCRPEFPTGSRSPLRDSRRHQFSQVRAFSARTPGRSRAALGLSPLRGTDRDGPPMVPNPRAGQQPPGQRVALRRRKRVRPGTHGTGGARLSRCSPWWGHHVSNTHRSGWPL